MKNTNQVPNYLIHSGLVLVVTAVAWLPVSALAQEQQQPMKPMKGGEHMIMLHQVNTPAQTYELKPGDSVAMVCAKCKSVTVETVTRAKGHIQVMTPGEKHLCPGCNSSLTVVGTGKGANTEVKHVCDKCGSDSAFCCATLTGSAPTQGMERK